MRMLLLHLLLMPFILAEENIFLDVIDYSHSEIQLSCRLEADWDMTNVYFKVSKGKDVCLYSTFESCETPSNCHMACLKNKDPKIILFWVKLDGRCDETTNIHCRIGSEQENVEKSLILKTQSDPPAISVNDGKPVEANYSEVQISCSISNVCYKTKLEIWGVPIEKVNTTHQKEGSRFKTTTISRAILSGAGNYEIFCKESEKEDQYTRSYIFVVPPSKNDTKDTDNRHVTKTRSSSFFIGLIAISFTFIFMLSICFVFVRRWYRKRRKLKTERGRTYNTLSSNDPLDGRNPANQQRRFLPVLQEAPKDCICGIWIKEDETNGEKLKHYIENQQRKEVRRAEIEKVDFIQEGPCYEKYFAMISVHSLKNQNFMAYLALVVSRTYNVACKFSVVLVLADKDALSILDWRQNSSDDVDRRSMMIKLQDLPSVNAFVGSFEDCQHRIADELQRPPPSTKDTNAFVNIGAGLAWSYYYGYLTLILPEISNRIEKFKDKMKHHGRMSPYFIIIVPESCRVHSKLKDVDPQFSSEESLDDQINKSIGYPECPSKTVVHHIKKNEGDCYYFCGEYATPVALLDKMQGDGKLTEVEMAKEQLLFTETLQSLLYMHSSYGGNTVVYTLKDVAAMVEGLSEYVTHQNKLDHPYNKELMQVTRVAEGLALSYYYYYLAIIGPKMEERIKSSRMDSREKMTNKFFILLPYSWESYEKLESADQENIKHIDNLYPQKTNAVKATEDNRIYETAIYEISASRKKYFACVEYCTPVQVMNQMAKMEWTPVQKARELRVLYETLHTLLYGPNSLAYCSTFELVYYDDYKEKLSTKLVTKIKEVMKRT